MRGETAIAWEKDDFEDYRSLRLRVDTMLQTMHEERQEPLTPTLIVFAVVLLVISYLIIQKDLREKARAKKWLEDTVKKLQDNIEENRRLIEARKRTGCGVSILSEKVGGTI